MMESKFTLKRLRIAMGYSPTQLAKKLGVHRDYIKNKESRYISHKALIKYMEQLGFYHQDAKEFRFVNKKTQSPVTIIWNEIDERYANEPAVRLKKKRSKRERRND